MISINFNRASQIPQSLITPFKQEVQNKVIVLAVVLFAFIAGFYLARCFYHGIIDSSKMNEDKPKLASPIPEVKAESEKVKEQTPLLVNPKAADEVAFDVTQEVPNKENPEIKTKEKKEELLELNQDIEAPEEEVELNKESVLPPSKILLDEHQPFMDLPLIEVPQMDESNPNGYKEHVDDVKPGPIVRLQFSDQFLARKPEEQFQQMQKEIQERVEKLEIAFQEAKKIYLNLLVRILAKDPSLKMKDIHRFDGPMYGVGARHVVENYKAILQIKNDHPQVDYTMEMQVVEKAMTKYRNLSGSWGEAQHWLYKVCERGKVWTKFHKH